MVGKKVQGSGQQNMTMMITSKIYLEIFTCHHDQISFSVMLTGIPDERAPFLYSFSYFHDL